MEETSRASSSVVQDGPPQDLTCRHEVHEVFAPPERPDSTIWRYLDFTKLVSLIATQQLYFARVDTFDDPFEGSVSAATKLARQEVYSDLKEDSKEEMLSALEQLGESARSWMYANCWNLSEVESAALWGLYVRAEGGVAIQSTYQRLVDAVAETSHSTLEPSPLWVGRVKYIDYKDDLIPDDNSFYPFVHKRKSFEFESELRAMTWYRTWRGVDEPSPIGLRVPVDLGKLIMGIYISPTAPPWFAELVRSVVDHYGCTAPVHQSSLSEQPIY